MQEMTVTIYCFGLSEPAVQSACAGLRIRELMPRRRSYPTLTVDHSPAKPQLLEYLSHHPRTVTYAHMRLRPIHRGPSTFL